MESRPLALDTTRQGWSWSPFLLVGAACFAGGWLALALGGAEAEAGPVWLPAGIALGALRIWGRSALAGAWFGCFGLWLATLGAQPDPAHVLVLAAALATAPVVGASSSLWLGQRIARFGPAGGELVALTGALPGSALAAAFTVAVLVYVGRVEETALAESFTRAWLADVSGVFVVAPLLVARLDASRAWTAHVALSLGVAVTLVVVHMLHANEARIARAEVQHAVEQRAIAIQADFSEVLEAVDALGTFFSASDGIYAARFEAYSAHTLTRMPAVRALEWLPRVPRRARASHEAQAVRSGIAGYRISEPGPKGPVRAGKRDAYFPVRFAAPLAPNVGDLGVDLAACPLRGGTLARARDALDIAVSPALQTADGGWTVLVALPVYPAGADPFAALDDDALQGFVAAVVNVGDLVENALARIEESGLDSLVLERDGEGMDMVLHAHAAQARGRPLSGHEIAALLAMQPGEAFRTAVPLGDRSLYVLSAPTAEARASLRSWAPLGALGAGWLISALLASWLSSIAGRTRRVEVLVGERTAELAAANSAKTAFLANMSHEVRTPMTAILGFADALADRELSREERSEIVDTIRRNGRSLLAILDDVLDISKIEAGRVNVERVPCSLVAPVEDTVSLLRGRALEKGIALSVDYRFPLPAEIQSDAGRVRQILMNLVSNAIKFTEVGGVRLTVWATDVESPAPRVHVEVVDDGIGIAPESLARLFQPFVQADSSMTRRFGGTGLGLAISKRLAQMLGGDIEVTSAPEEGSRFHVWLDPGPLAGVPLLHALVPNADPRDGVPDSSAVSLRGRILLAEDTKDTRVLLRHFLTRAGLTVEIAENGSEALATALAAEAAGEPFDVVLMDMQMPVLDGYEATRALRSAGYTRPIVALTAHTMAGERETCLATGCDDYASKPIDRPTLLAIVSRFLEKSGSGA